jgi:Protein of unknown function (DUF3383)
VRQPAPIELRNLMRIVKIMNRQPARSVLQKVVVVGVICCGLSVVTRAGTAAGAAQRVENTVTVTNEMPSATRDYPLQLGRPFLKGAIPAGRCPHLALAEGAAGRQPRLASQADVKNRYPDGSVEYAIIAAILPVVPTHRRITLGFVPGECANPPLSKEQMLGSHFDFDPKITFTSPATLYGLPLPPPATALLSLTAITDGGFSLVVSGRRYSLTGLDFSKQRSLAGVVGVVAAALKAAGEPVQIALQPKAVGDLGASDAAPRLVTRFVLTTTGFSGRETIGKAEAPATGSDISATLGLSAGATMTPGQMQTVSARTMLTNGDYTLWTSGPVAQTIMLGDDTAARKYDIGFGDGYHPLRPRFYATFWPATHQVSVRVVAENGLTSEVEDLAYKLSITAGRTPPSVVYSGDLSGTQTTHPKSHWALTGWTERFWLGGTPNPQVDIDHNLAYLASTRFLPNYDISIKPSAANIASMYGYWTTKPHDLYDGAWDGGMWQSGMGVAGARGEIAPYPSWTMLWLYTGDWRLRQMALGMADLAASFPGQLRESVTGKRLSRADPAGASTGLGHTVSITDRKTLLSQYLTYNYTKPPDRVAIVGSTTRGPWSFDTAHEPSAFYPQYLLTGDPWYLSEMYLWAGFSAAAYNGANNNCSCGRGPTGAEGAIDDQLRGAAWVGRNRAEIAFIAPDNDPEKAYFTYLMNDALAKWEGGLGITGTVFDGTAEKVWSAKYGNYYSITPGGNHANGSVSPLRTWQAGGAPPNGQDASIVNNVLAGIYPMAPPSTSLVASLSGSMLTVTSVSGAPLSVRTLLSDATGRLKPFTYIRSTPAGGGAGGAGAYTVLPGGQTVASETMRGSKGSAAVGLFDAVWTDWYLSYSLSRIEELGFAADPLRSRQIHYMIGMINDSGHPTLITTYELPIASPTAWYTDWAGVVSGLTPAFLTGVGWDRAHGADLPQYFTANLGDDGRPIWGMAGLADAVAHGDPGAAQAWRWFLENVYRAIPAGKLEGDPKWAIVPRTDANALPSQPTATPPS